MRITVGIPAYNEEKNIAKIITKLKKITTVETIKNIPEKHFINVTIDEKKKTITFTDNGVGLDAEEVQKYINQVAFSGATDFIEKYKEKEDDKNNKKEVLLETLV